MPRSLDHEHNSSLGEYVQSLSRNITPSTVSERDRLITLRNFSESIFCTPPLFGPLLFKNVDSDARDHCANERSMILPPLLPQLPHTPNQLNNQLTTQTRLSIMAPPLNVPLHRQHCNRDILPLQACTQRARKEALPSPRDMLLGSESYMFVCGFGELYQGVCVPPYSPPPISPG